MTATPRLTDAQAAALRVLRAVADDQPDHYVRQGMRPGTIRPNTAKFLADHFLAEREYPQIWSDRFRITARGRAALDELEATQ